MFSVIRYLFLLELDMIKILKYVIDTTNTPVLFSREQLHDTVRAEAQSAGYLLLRYNHKISTWFVVCCFGESTTLNIKSKPVLDKKIIEGFLKASQTEARFSFDYV